MFVKCSRNGTFLFLRDYMDYHSDRFMNHSLMYYSDKGELLAVMAANETISSDGKKELHSHQGLTYGGLILSEHTKTIQVLEMFDVTIEYLKKLGFSEWHYKQIPTCYHRIPSEEDEYALWRLNAVLESCLISTAIPLNGCTVSLDVERRRKRGQTKALKKGYKIFKTDDMNVFWRIMESNLYTRYSVRPVHTVEEMMKLRQSFPDKIFCFVIKQGDDIEGGCIIYIANDTCVHIQYGHSTPKGRKDGVLDLLYLSLIDLYSQKGYRYLDFGNSNEEEGLYLNKNLIAQKEGFGGRGIVYKQFMIKL